MSRPRSTPATEAQVAYVASLLNGREVPNDLRERVHTASMMGLTHGACLDLIPELERCPWTDDYADWSTPEGYDDSPDQGIHQFDGGFGDGSFL